MKPEDKFEYLDEKGKLKKAEWSNFEHLQKQVQYMARILEQYRQIFVDNKLNQLIEPFQFTEELVYEDLLAERKEEPEEKEE